MKISATYRGRLTAAAVILAGAVAVVGALSPAASDELRPFLQTLGIISCTSNGPCQEGKNASSGPGLEGISAKGNGVIGQTTFNSTSSSNGQAGLLGQDKSTTGVFDAGVFGKSTRGRGVVGQSTSGVGVTGTSSSLEGMVGTSTFGVGVFGSSTGGSSSSVGVEGNTGLTHGSGGLAGVLGVNNLSSTAVYASGFGGPLFVGNNSNGLDVFSVDDGGFTTATGGLFAGSESTNLGAEGEGGQGVVGIGVGANPVGVLALNDASSGGEALVVQDLSGTGVLIDGSDSGNNLKFQVDDTGNVFAHSFNATLIAQRQATSIGRPVTTYAHQSSMPTLEDFGETQLADGQAYVPLERTFAAAIDKRAAYLVFITPEGDTRGLYVTQKTPAGFSVRENQGGHSTVAFSYRIVAKPYGSTAQRLAPAPEMHRAVAPPRPRLRMPEPHHVPKSRI